MKDDPAGQRNEYQFSNRGETVVTCGLVAEQRMHHQITGDADAIPHVFLIGVDDPAMFILEDLADDGAKDDFAMTARLPRGRR
jgi:hypothetical protein